VSLFHESAINLDLDLVRYSTFKYRLGKYSYARETDRSSSRALPPMNARLGMLEAIIMTVIPKQSQLKMVRFKILTEDHLYE